MVIIFLDTFRLKFVILNFVIFTFSLRIPLSQDFAEVRAATLRAFRYLISSEDNVEDFIKLNCHCLVAR